MFSCPDSRVHAQLGLCLTSHLPPGLDCLLHILGCSWLASHHGNLWWSVAVTSPMSSLQGEQGWLGSVHQPRAEGGSRLYAWPPSLAISFGHLNSIKPPPIWPILLSIYLLLESQPRSWRETSLLPSAVGTTLNLQAHFPLRFGPKVWKIRTHTSTRTSPSGFFIVLTLPSLEEWARPFLRCQTRTSL